MEQDARAIADQPIDPATPLYKVPSFRLLFITRVASTTAFQMVGVIVGWHVYELTNSALHLGLIGLAQFLPQFFLMLPAGQIADRLNRRTVLWWCYGARVPLRRRADVGGVAGPPDAGRSSMRWSRSTWRRAPSSSR